uniref:Putative secreted protein n=1 Tax=Anopheles darlingi TaxID=43151 RepID=A0A2M4DGX8_ANODA
MRRVATSAAAVAAYTTNGVSIGTCTRVYNLKLVRLVDSVEARPFGNDCVFFFFMFTGAQFLYDFTAEPCD